MRNCSRPDASSWATSVTAGTCRSRRTTSKRHSSSVLGVHGSWVVHPIWPSISSKNRTDLRRRRFRLPALQADQQALVFLKVEQEFEDAVRDQGDADHRHEEQHVFAKQAAAKLRLTRRLDRTPGLERGRSFDHLVGDREQQARHLQSECSRRV